jgi:hypothetical protein
MLEETLHTVLMVEIKDLPPSMQPHVVGAPRMCVRLFRHLANYVDHYNRANRPRPQFGWSFHVPRALFVHF